MILFFFQTLPARGDSSLPLWLCTEALREENRKRCQKCWTINFHPLLVPDAGMGVYSEKCGALMAEMELLEEVAYAVYWAIHK